MEWHNIEHSKVIIITRERFSKLFVSAFLSPHRHSWAIWISQTKRNVADKDKKVDKADKETTVTLEPVIIQEKMELRQFVKVVQKLRNKNKLWLSFVISIY